MTIRVRTATGAAAGMLLCLGAGSAMPAQPASPDPATPRPEATIPMKRASGTFEVKLAPLPAHAASEDSLLGRMSIDKEFRGDLEGTSRGEMLTALTPVQGSAGYVAIERVSGALHGRRGTFVLQHGGTMTRGAPQLVITIVPDSGTGELAGLAGTMRIIVEGSKHSYELEYTLPGAP
jgi:hypothetical protein